MLAIDSSMMQQWVTCRENGNSICATKPQACMQISQKPRQPALIGVDHLRPSSMTASLPCSMSKLKFESRSPLLPSHVLESVSSTQAAMAAAIVASPNVHGSLLAVRVLLARRISTVWLGGKLNLAAHSSLTSAALIAATATQPANNHIAA